MMIHFLSGKIALKTYLVAVDVIRIRTLGAIDELVFASAVNAILIVLDLLFLFGTRVAILQRNGNIEG